MVDRVNRIKELRKNKALTLKELSQKLLTENKIKISPDALAKYERGDREPKIEKWEALANFFNVSVPYLQGIEDKPTNGYSKEYIFQQLANAYKENWKDPTGNIMGGGFAGVVDAYLSANSIKKPSKLNKSFWKTNFNFIFDNPNVERLLTTKDTYSDDVIKLLLSYAIMFNFPQFKEVLADFYKGENNKRK